MEPTDSGGIRTGTRLLFGSDAFTFENDVEELRDSSVLLGNIEALRDRMAEDGYLFIRGFFERELVLRARLRVLQHLAKEGLLRPGESIESGMSTEENRSVGLFRNLEVAHSPEVLAVVDGPLIRQFFSEFLGGEIITFDKRWLRAMARGGSNGWHYDSVFMNRGTANLYTCWTPLGDVPLTDGPLGCFWAPIASAG
ncbi:MAG: hypothetical protein LC772_11400 [Chloroflexi bacterium]|nr:hypothetical protein [Chloroflexota bacterium]